MTMADAIGVRSLAGLAAVGGGAKREFRVPPAAGTSPRSILDELAIPESAVAFVLVNGRKGDLNAELRESDRVAFIAPAGGG